jgi:hypothetical protein
MTEEALKCRKAKGLSIYETILRFEGALNIHVRYYVNSILELKQIRVNLLNISK